MKKLSKEKRQHLILTVIVTLTVLSGLWYGVIRSQQRAIEKVAEDKLKVDGELANVRDTIARADQIQKQLEEASALLQQSEVDMATGDIYAWMITKIREFKAAYRVDIPQFSQIDGPRETNLLPGFPYKQASLTIGGSGLFQDIGRFICDFENKYPFMRLCNLVVEPSAGNANSDKEKLSFHVEIVALVKPMEKVN